MFCAGNSCRTRAPCICFQFLDVAGFRCLQGETTFACLQNLQSLSQVPRNNIPCVLQIGVPDGGRYEVVMSSDSKKYGGCDRIGVGIEHFSQPEGVPGEGGFFVPRIESPLT